VARKGGRRRGIRDRCPDDGKTTFRTYDTAFRVAGRLPDKDNRIYWCVAAGGYHFTRSTIEEYSRRRAQKRFEEEPTVLTWQLGGPAVERIGLGGDCPTCGWRHGFHDPTIHAKYEVPRHLAYGVGEDPPWKRQ
jgi:hypothetical protein